MSRGTSGSLESLASMGADSVMTGVEAGSGDGISTRKPSIGSPQPRSPLQSSSSLELSPRMEQVIFGINRNYFNFQLQCMNLKRLVCL